MTDLEDFHGKVMKLEGVDECTESVKQWGDNFENCSVIRFKLDGVVYVAIEDPDDGYRSYLGELKVDTKEITNAFTGVEVKGVYKESGDVILCLVDTTTNETVLTVGTDYSDNYYPYFVANFNPAAMSVNQ